LADLAQTAPQLTEPGLRAAQGPYNMGTHHHQRRNDVRRDRRSLAAAARLTEPWNQHRCPREAREYRLSFCGRHGVFAQPGWANRLARSSALGCRTAGCGQAAVVCWVDDDRVLPIRSPSRVRRGPFGLVERLFLAGGRPIFVHVGGQEKKGPGGVHVVEAGPGDFLHVPKGVVHCDGSPGDEESRLVVVRAGRGPAVVNVDGPAMARLRLARDMSPTGTAVGPDARNAAG
jgi:hypothetical protein